MTEREANAAANDGPPHVAAVVRALLARVNDGQHARDPETLARYAYFLQRLAMAYMQRTTGEARSAEEDHREDTAPG